MEGEVVVSINATVGDLSGKELTAGITLVISLWALVTFGATRLPRAALTWLVWFINTCARRIPR